METAYEEFPDYDVTVREPVSIEKCLMDPLAEMVRHEDRRRKIDSALYVDGDAQIIS